MALLTRLLKLCCFFLYSHICEMKVFVLEVVGIDNTFFSMYTRYCGWYFSKVVSV